MRLGSLAWPYWKSDEKWSAIGLLAAVVALNLFSVWLNVRLNRWNNDFYNALQQYDWTEFWWQFGIFGMLAVAMIVDRRLFTLSAADSAYPLAPLADRPLSA